MELYGRQVSIWDGTFTRSVTRHYRISLCTSCMGRTHDLKQTLPVNIRDNSDYPDVEFVILDYNSDDGLEDWMRRNMMEHVESGLVAYYHTTEPTHFHFAHARNVSFLAATGEIVNNIDADNWTTGGLATYVNRLANQCPRKAIFAKGKRMLKGRIGLFRDEWLELGGYDERMANYGPEDRDLLNRAWLTGFTLMWYGGRYTPRLTTPGPMNTRDRNTRRTYRTYKALSHQNLTHGRYRANEGVRWGVAHLLKNFQHEVEVGSTIPPPI